MPDQPTSGKRETAVTVLLWISIPLMLVLPLLIIFPRAFRDAQAQNHVARAYLPVDARVVSSQVNTSTGSKGRIYYEPEVQYQYEVNGAKYHSGRLAAFWLDGGEEWAEGVVAQFKTGTTCRAYYDPENPAQAVLFRKYYLQPYREMLEGAFIFSGGLFMVLQIWFSKKYPPAPVEGGWFELRPNFGERQRLQVARLCTIAWYGLGAVPMAHFFLCVPPPYGRHVLADFSIFAALGLVPAGFLVRYLLMCRHLDEARLRINGKELYLGRPFSFAVSQRSRLPSHVKWFRARVLCVGTVGRGKSRTYSTVYETTAAELENHDLRPGEDLEISGKLILPPDQRPSGRDDTGKYSWITWKLELECKLTGAPDYDVEFPLAVQGQRAAPEETAAPFGRPRELAQTQPVPPEYAGRIKAKGKIAVLLKMLPVVIQLLGIGIMASVFASAFPGKLGFPQLMDLPRLPAELVFAIGAVLTVVSSALGLVCPNIFGGRYTFTVATKEIKRRRDAIVEPDAGTPFVEIIPRRNWNRLNLKAEDIGFLALDAGAREIRFEGDQERYRIPAAAIESCQLEKSVFAPTAPPTAPGVWLVVLRVATSAGITEVPIAPCTSKSRTSTKLRLQAARALHAKIENLLPRERRQPASGL